MQRVHDLCPYQCRICKKRCRRQNDLACHMVIRHEKGEKKFPCVKCGKSFCLEENFERHVKLHDLEEVKPLVCDMCDDRFEDEERLQKHLTTQTHVNQFKCHLCVITCRSKVHLER